MNLEEFAKLAEPIQKEQTDRIVAAEEKAAAKAAEDPHAYLLTKRKPYRDTNYWDRVGPMIDAHLLYWRQVDIERELDETIARIEIEAINKLAQLEEEWLKSQP